MIDEMKTITVEAGEIVSSKFRIRNTRKKKKENKIMEEEREEGKNLGPLETILEVEETEDEKFEKCKKCRQQYREPVKGKICSMCKAFM